MRPWCATGEAGARNLMGFVDGTADLHTDDDLILRRGLNDSRGFDGSGRLDQGLAFVSYQRRMSQFLNTQARLKGEPPEEYIQPQGGGFFFALPGAPEGSWFGQSLLG